VLKTCLHCGVEFEGAPQARFHADACRKAYNRELGQKEGENSDIQGPGRELGQTLSEAEEQALRDRFGYAKSETRTKAERDAVAAQIIGRASETLTEDAYVAECMKLPPLVAAQAPPSQPQTTYEERYAAARRRQEAYARWRYRGWRSGEVASL
jgi:hypothetical protein